MQIRRNSSSDCRSTGLAGKCVTVLFSISAFVLESFKFIHHWSGFAKFKPSKTSFEGGQTKDGNVSTNVQNSAAVHEREGEEHRNWSKIKRSTNLQNPFHSETVARNELKPFYLVNCICKVLLLSWRILSNCCTDCRHCARALVSCNCNRNTATSSHQLTEPQDGRQDGIGSRRIRYFQPRFRLRKERNPEIRNLTRS